MASQAHIWLVTFGNFGSEYPGILPNVVLAT